MARAGGRRREGWSLMLMPKRVRYRKQKRGRMKGYAKGGTTVAFGEYGLKAVDRGWISNREIEAARVAMTRKIKRGGKVWINIFPDKPVTKKPAETRMGSGKGNPEGWVAVVKPGRVMFEIAGVDDELAIEAMRLAGHKLPIRTKIVQPRGGRRGLEDLVKAAEVHNMKDDELVERAQGGARGAVRPPPPARHRRAREHRARRAAAPRHRPPAHGRQGARHRPRQGTRPQGLRWQTKRKKTKKRRPKRLRPRPRLRRRTPRRRRPRGVRRSEEVEAPAGEGGGLL